LKKKLLEIIKSQLVKAYGIYGLTSLLNAAIPFLFLPILTKYLSTSDYGYTAMFTVLCSFVSPILGASTDAAISRQYFNKDTIDLKVYIGNCFIILFASLFPVILFFYFFSGLISNLSEFPINFLWPVIIFSFFSYIVNVTAVLWRVQSKAFEYGVFQIGQTIVNILLSLFLVVVINTGWQGRILAQVITFVLFGFIGFYIIFKNNLISFKFNIHFIKNALRFGIPLIPHAYGAVILTMTDRVMITKMIGISDTGLYAIGYAFGGIIGFIENSFNLAYIPWLYERLKRNDDKVKTKIVKFTYLYFVIIILLALLLSLASPLILKIMVDKKFEGAGIYVLWISLSFAFSGMYKMVVNYIFYIEKTAILAWITFGSSIINLGSTYFFIIKFGAVGAAMSAALVSFCFFIFTWIYSNKVYSMPWNLLKVTKVI
jgi:O-antigen/teichoic acid export membrane protein